MCWGNHCDFFMLIPLQTILYEVIKVKWSKIGNYCHFRYVIRQVRQCNSMIRSSVRHEGHVGPIKIGQRWRVGTQIISSSDSRLIKEYYTRNVIGTVSPACCWRWAVGGIGWVCVAAYYLRTSCLIHNYFIWSTQVYNNTSTSCRKENPECIERCAKGII